MHWVGSSTFLRTFFHSFVLIVADVEVQEVKIMNSRMVDFAPFKRLFLWPAQDE
jgi:hypothetical protein